MLHAVLALCLTSSPSCRMLAGWEAASVAVPQNAASAKTDGDGSSVYQ